MIQDLPLEVMMLDIIGLNEISDLALLDGIYQLN
jgi:hypothetical protein